MSRCVLDWPCFSWEKEEEKFGGYTWIEISKGRVYRGEWEVPSAT